MAAVLASGFALLVGLYLAIFADVGGDMRLFGWLLVIVGAIGLILRSVLASVRRPGRPGRPRPPR